MKISRNEYRGVDSDIRSECSKRTSLRLYKHVLPCIYKYVLALRTAAY